MANTTAEKIVLERYDGDTKVTQYPATISSQVYDFDNNSTLDESLKNIKQSIGKNSSVEVLEVIPEDLSDKKIIFKLEADRGDTPTVPTMNFDLTERLNDIDEKINSYSGVHSSGSNANGTWIRFDDGTMIAHFNSTVQVGLPSAYGSMLYSGVYLWTYPVPFSSAPTVSVGMMKWGTGASWGTVNSSSSTNCSVFILDILKREVGNTTTMLTAIGRWK